MREREGGEGGRGGGGGGGGEGGGGGRGEREGGCKDLVSWSMKPLPCH